MKKQYKMKATKGKIKKAYNGIQKVNPNYDNLLAKKTQQDNLSNAAAQGIGAGLDKIVPGAGTIFSTANSLSSSLTKDEHGIYKNKASKFIDERINPMGGVNALLSGDGSAIANYATFGLAGRSLNDKNIAMKKEADLKGKNDTFNAGLGGIENTAHQKGQIMKKGGTVGDNPYGKVSSKEINKQKDFYSKYISSPTYKERLTKAGYSNPNQVIADRKAIIPETMVHNNKYYDGTEDSARSRYYMDKQEVDVSTRQAKKSKTRTSTISAHELSHAISSTRGGVEGKSNPNLNMNSWEEEQINKRNRQRKVDENGTVNQTKSYLNDTLGTKFTKSYGHDSQPNEAKADLDAYRYQLYQDGEYDITKGKKFEKSHLNKSNKNIQKEVPYKRLKKNFSDDDIVWMMNNLADNKKNENVPIAAKGKSNSDQQVIEIEGKKMPEIHTDKNFNLKNLGTTPHSKGGNKVLAETGDVVFPTQNSPEKFNKILTAIENNDMYTLKKEQSKLPEDDAPKYGKGTRGKKGNNRKNNPNTKDKYGVTGKDDYYTAGKKHEKALRQKVAQAKASGNTALIESSNRALESFLIKGTSIDVAMSQTGAANVMLPLYKNKEEALEKRLEYNQSILTNAANQIKIALETKGVTDAQKRDLKKQLNELSHKFRKSNTKADSLRNAYAEEKSSEMRAAQEKELNERLTQPSQLVPKNIPSVITDKGKLQQVAGVFPTTGNTKETKVTKPTSSNPTSSILASDNLSEILPKQGIKGTGMLDDMKREYSKKAEGRWKNAADLEMWRASPEGQKNINERNKNTAEENKNQGPYGKINPSAVYKQILPSERSKVVEAQDNPYKQIQPKAKAPKKGPYITPKTQELKSLGEQMGVNNYPVGNHQTRIPRQASGFGDFAPDYIPAKTKDVATSWEQLAPKTNNPAVLKDKNGNPLPNQPIIGGGGPGSTSGGNATSGGGGNPNTTSQRGGNTTTSGNGNTTTNGRNTGNGTTTGGNVTGGTGRVGNSKLAPAQGFKQATNQNGLKQIDGLYNDEVNRKGAYGEWESKVKKGFEDGSTKLLRAGEKGNPYKYNVYAVNAKDGSGKATYYKQGDDSMIDLLESKDPLANNAPTYKAPDIKSMGTLDMSKGLPEEKKLGSKLGEGMDLGNLSKYAGIANNLIQSFKRPEVEQPELINPELIKYQDRSDPLRKQSQYKMNMDMATGRNISGGNVANYRANAQGAGMDNYGRQEGINNNEMARADAIDVQNVGIKNQAQMYNSQATALSKENNAKNRAVSDTYRDTAMNDIAKVSQVNEQMKNQKQYSKDYLTLLGEMGYNYKFNNLDDLHTQFVGDNHVPVKPVTSPTTETVTEKSGNTTTKTTKKTPTFAKGVRKLSSGIRRIFNR